MRARGKGDARAPVPPVRARPIPAARQLKERRKEGREGEEKRAAPGVRPPAARHLESARTWSPPAAWNPPRRKSSSALLLCASSALLSAPLRRPQPLRYMHISSPLLLLFFALPFTSFVLYSHKPCAQSVTCVVPSDLVPSHKPSANNFLLLACAYLIVDTVDLCMQYQPTGKNG